MFRLVPIAAVALLATLAVACADGEDTEATPAATATGTSTSSPTASAAPTNAPASPTPGTPLELGVYSVAADGSGLRLLLPGLVEADSTPDGRYVAGAEFCTHPGHLQIVDSQSGDARLLATFAGVVTRVEIAPDGERIIVAELSPERRESLLYLVDSDGREVPLPLFEGWNVEWSPDSTRIRLISESPSAGDWTLSVYEVATGQTTVVATTSYALRVAWSPGSTYLAYSAASDERSSDAQTWLWDRDTGTRRMLAGGDVVAWFPDGQSVAVIKSGGQNVSLERVWIDGSKSVALGEASGFAISPNGDFIAKRIFTPQKAELRIASGETEIVVPGPAEPVGDMVFSPDSRTLAFIGQEYSRDVGGAIVDATGVNAYAVDVDGAALRKIAETLQSAILGWTPDGAILFASIRLTGCEQPFR